MMANDGKWCSSLWSARLPQTLRVPRTLATPFCCSVWTAKISISTYVSPQGVHKSCCKGVPRFYSIYMCICDCVCVHINRAPWEPTSREHISHNRPERFTVACNRLQSLTLPRQRNTWATRIFNLILSWLILISYHNLQSWLNFT